MENSNDMVTLERSVYDELMHYHIWVTALESAGVDSWDGYETAQDIFNELNNNK